MFRRPFRLNGQALRINYTNGSMILQPAVYVLTSKRNGTLYIGVTSNSIKRVWEHRNDLSEGFTKRYQIHQLVWYEMHMTMAAAIAREKQLKNWKREWKIELIEQLNPEWMDIYKTII